MFHAQGSTDYEGLQSQNLINANFIKIKVQNKHSKQGPNLSCQPHILQAVDFVQKYPCLTTRGPIYGVFLMCSKYSICCFRKRTGQNNMQRCSQNLSQKIKNCENFLFLATENFDPVHGGVVALVLLRLGAHGHAKDPLAGRAVLQAFKCLIEAGVSNTIELINSSLQTFC